MLHAFALHYNSVFSAHILGVDGLSTRKIKALSARSVSTHVEMLASSKSE